MEKKRSAPMISIQKEMLVEFMQSNPMLQSGKFTNEFTFKKAQKLWEEITEKLNSVARGGKKDWRQWRKTWQDLKKNSKAKAAKERAHASLTGGGEPSDTKFDAIELKVLDILSSVSVRGLDNVEEPTIVFDFDDTEQDENNMAIMEVSSTPADEPQEVVVAPNEAENSVGDATKTASLVTSTPVASKLKGGPLKSNKTRRLETSLKLSQELVNGLDRKSDVLQKYYETKSMYLQHRMQYETKKLLAIEKQTTILANIDKNLSSLMNERNK